VHLTGGRLRVFKQFVWLEVYSDKMALSRPAPAQVTQTVRRLFNVQEIRNSRNKEKFVNNNRIALLIFVSVLFLTACAPSASQIQDAINQTQAVWTPVPTQTTLPPIEVTRIVMVTPTSTPLPIYTPIAPDLPAVRRVIYSDSFDKLSSSWQANGNTEVANGHLIIKAPGSIVYNPVFQENHGYLLLFRTDPLTTFSLVCDYGPWGNSSYRGFMLINASLFSIYTGSNFDQHEINFNYTPQTWYYALVWLTPNSAEGKIWEKDNPQNSRSFSIDRNGFSYNILNYWVNIMNKGSIEIDEFQELQFSK
jgi:hypothetical protein